MKLKRILAMLVALAIAISIVPMVFSATAGIDIDFTSTGFDGFSATGSGKPSDPEDNPVSGIYGKAATDYSRAIETSATYNRTSASRAYKNDVAVSKAGTRLSFKIAAADKNSIKAVSFDTGTSAPGIDLFSMEKDGKMYLLGDEICEYETGRWYQIDIVFASTGAYTIYVDGGYTAKVTATSTATLTDIFGSDTADTENRNLFYYLKEKDSNVASTMYVDDFETETTDSTSAASVPASRKLEAVYNGSATFENGVMKNIGDGATVDGILADFTVTSGVVKIVDSIGAEVTSGDVAPGMKLIISSQDESIKLEYTLDCLNLVFTAPSGTTTRNLTQTISATFNGAGSVEFWVNGVLKATDTEAPYQYTVEHTAGGEYAVKAVVITAGDVRTESETKTYTFVENAVPTVSLTDVNGNADGSVGVGQTDTVALNVKGEDTDGGVIKVELYFDGNKVAERESATPVSELTLAENYTRTGLSLGVHSYYAKAYDADGGAATSAEKTFTVITTSSQDIDTVTFDDGTGRWQEFNSTNFEIKDDPIRPDNKVLAYEDKPSQTLLMSGNSGIPSGILYWEADYMTTDASKAFTMLIREPDGLQNDVVAATAQNGAIGSYAISANTWYTIRMVANFKSGKANIYVSADGGSSWTPAQTDIDITAVSSIGTLRIYVNGTNQSGWNCYIDNIKLYSKTESAYLAKTEYLNAAGASVASGNKVSPDVRKIVMSYNNAVDNAGITKDNFKITDSDGNEFTRYSVSVSGITVTITLDVELLSQETYTITIKDLDASLAAGTPESITFTTDAARFDVTAVTAKVNGSALSSLAAVQTGDTLTADLTFKNTTGSAKNISVICVICSGDKMIGVSELPATIPATGGTVTTAPASITGVIDDVVTARVFVWSDSGATRAVEMGIVE